MSRGGSQTCSVSKSRRPRSRLRLCRSHYQGQVEYECAVCASDRIKHKTHRFYLQPRRHNHPAGLYIADETADIPSICDTILAIVRLAAIPRVKLFQRLKLTPQMDKKPLLDHVQFDIIRGSSRDSSKRSASATLLASKARGYGDQHMSRVPH